MDNAPKNFPKEYKSWAHMKGRCYCETNHKYPNYGGRGIAVCDEWVDDFPRFLCDMGPRPSPKHSIDRIDNDGDYTPDNCRWATPRKQSNNRRSSRLLTYKGQEKTVAQWARYAGIRQHTLAARIDRHGMSVAEAIETPVRTPKRAKYTHNGITDSVTGWSKRLGYGRNTLHERMRRQGMTFKEAIAA